MPKKEALMVKTFMDNDAIELTAKTQSSILVKDIRIFNAAGKFATVSIDNVTVGYFRVGGALGSHLPFTCGSIATSAAGQLGMGASQRTILGYLADKGIFKGYPVAEGENFRVDGVAGSGSITVIVYEEYDAGEIKNTDENGSKSKSYVYLNYGDTGNSINVTGETPYTRQLTLKTFPQYPFGVQAPFKYKTSLLGVLASDASPKENTGSNACLTCTLKLVKGRVTLFDEDKRGIPLISTRSTIVGSVDNVGVGASLAGNYSTVDSKEPLMFPEPIVAQDGDELNVYLSTVKVGNGQPISTELQEIAFITRVEEVA